MSELAEKLMAALGADLQKLEDETAASAERVERGDAELRTLSPEEQEHEWAAMRADRDQFQRRAALLEQQNKEAEEYAGRMEAALENIRIVCRMARRQEEPSDLESREALDVIDHIARVRDHRGGTAKELALQRRVEATEAELRETAGELEKARALVARCLPGSPNPITWAEAPGLAASGTEELPCPGCGRPMARVGGPGAHRGWTCVNCNAAGDPEEDH